MKRNIFVFLFILLLIPAARVDAQNEIAAIDSLTIELWPDYDRAAVLVLLTGLLPDDTRFPATVTVPLHENAQLNAVARIDGRDGIMKDDISSIPGPSGMLMFITPDLRFRVEYYMPYTVNGNQRLFDYSWLADIAVNNLHLKIQQPKAATSFNVKPPAIDIVTEGDGLTYHAFPPRAVLAGRKFSVHLEYEMTTTRLSANMLPSARAESQVSGELSPSATGSRINWAILAIIAGSLLTIIGVVWLIASRRNQINTHEPHSQKPQKQRRAEFCRDCGEPVDKADKWCGQCGTNL
jgi:hypothetical protein